ncbi:MAG: hypothetical protein GEV09_00250 [Pseudonocardiaceae bacterium]|nr:hypothetical protein [Pseudonocardiaceae bacterium]
MPERKTLLVGSIPAGGAEEAMTQALREVGPQLRHLPDGETGERDRWVVGIVNSMRSNPDLEVRREGDWSNYQNQLNFTVRKGHTLTGASLEFGHVEAYRDSRPIFERLREQYGHPELAFQVGIPGDFDMALFTMGLTGPFRHRRPFTDATVREIEQIHALAGDDAVFQLEVPAELVFVTQVPSAVQPLMSAWMGTVVANLAAKAPRGARFGVHLCLGDLGHKAMGKLSDAGPLVRLTHAITRRWPQGRPLEYVHAPLAAGEQPPVQDPSFYRPLAELRMPAATRFVAGFLHEDRTTGELRQILDRIESHLGRTVDIAAACGLARRGTTTVMRQTTELCNT